MHAHLKEQVRKPKARKALLLTKLEDPLGFLWFVELSMSPLPTKGKHRFQNVRPQRALQFCLAHAESFQTSKNCERFVSAELRDLHHPVTQRIYNLCQIDKDGKICAPLDHPQNNYLFFMCACWGGQGEDWIHHINLCVQIIPSESMRPEERPPLIFLVRTILAVVCETQVVSWRRDSCRPRIEVGGGATQIQTRTRTH